MAKVDNADVTSLFMNPSAYTQVKDDGKSRRNKPAQRTGGKTFSRIFDEFRVITGDELGPVRDLPVSEETATLLMDEVHSAGSALRDKPCPDEIIRYKQAVRNFMHYVVKNSFTVENEKGLPRFMRPAAVNQPGTARDDAKTYIKINVIDAKLENFAAGILTGQISQLKLIAGLEEINGLLIDLLQ
ncbi:MAG: YaaR family protein [Treponema sp.]|nr:YaaR family protein [Treponema sp.]